MDRRPRRRGVSVAILLLVGLAFLLGYLLRGASTGAPAAAGSPEPTQETGQVWTCSMHPQVRLPGPGTCPICSMPLIPAARTGAGPGIFRLTLGEGDRALVRVETVPVQRREIVRELRSVGKVQYNETALASVTTRVDGYVERLFVDYTGITVSRGDHLIEIYSPDLVIAENELLLAARRVPVDSMLDQAKMKLLRWGITPDQTEEILKAGKAVDRMTLYSPVTGTVIEKLVVEKSAVKAGDVLYRLANLDSVWVHLDIYEFEVSLVQYGQTVELTAEAYPGRSFTGLVTFISPVLDEASRSVKVRVIVGNRDRLMKPGMFVSAVIRVPLRSDGRPAPTGVEGQFYCPMHPEIIQAGKGSCPICRMPLEQLPGSEPERPAGGAPSRLVLAVPGEAVLDSGTRKLVYVERTTGEFEPVQVLLGPRAGGYYPVLKGLAEGDRVARRGNFLIDSQVQIQGGPSLLGSPVTTGHGSHAGMAGSSSAMPPTTR